MEVKRHVSMALHILVGQQNVHNWQLVRIYMKTPPNHYYLESSVRATYMDSSLLNLGVNFWRSLLTG
jgi:hypothetical protein